MSLPSQARQLDLDLVRTVAIFGTVLIHATAVGGFNWAFGSAAWTANLFWSSLLRCAVPLFLMCSGALFLDPGRDLPLKTLWGKYMFRIAVALVFWATAYLVWGLWLQGDMNWPGLSWASFRTARTWSLVNCTWSMRLPMTSPRALIRSGSRPLEKSFRALSE